jgi:hypothetical protein
MAGALVPLAFLLPLFMLYAAPGKAVGLLPLLACLAFTVAALAAYGLHAVSVSIATGFGIVAVAILFAQLAVCMRRNFAPRTNLWI